MPPKRREAGEGVVDRTDDRNMVKEGQREAGSLK